MGISTGQTGSIVGEDTSTRTFANEESNIDNGDSDNNDWTAKTIVATIFLFIAAGFAEIGGGWLVWQTMRNDKPKYWAVLGSLILILYGFIPTFQPSVDSFGRVYAVYGGFFIVLAALWGWALDGDRPDAGDLAGGTIALGGVLVVLFWPRTGDNDG